MEGLNLKGSPQAIDSVDAVQIDSMVSSLRSLLDPLPNSSFDNYYSPPSWSSSCRSSDSIFDNPCTNQSWDNLIPLQLLLRLLFNLEISNRGESKRISSSSEISPEIEDKSSMEEISFKIFHNSSMEWNFSSFRGLRSFRLRKGNRLRKFLGNVFFGGRIRDSNSRQRSRWWRAQTWDKTTARNTLNRLPAMFGD